MNDTTQILKVTLIGDSSVGKTSFIMRLLYDKFDSPNISTLGVSFFSTMEQASDGTNYKLHIWDTAGQERFRSLVPMYLRNVDIILLVYDLSDSRTLDSLTNYWIKYIQKEHFDKEPLYFLIGAKSDLLDADALDNVDKEMERYVLHNCIFSNYISISSLNGQNIGNALKIILDTVCKKRNCNDKYTFSATIRHSLCNQVPDNNNKCCV